MRIVLNNSTTLPEADLRASGGEASPVGGEPPPGVGPRPRRARGRTYPWSLLLSAGIHLGVIVAAVLVWRPLVPPEEARVLAFQWMADADALEVEEVEEIVFDTVAEAPPADPLLPDLPIEAEEAPEVEELEPLPDPADPVEERPFEHEMDLVGRRTKPRLPPDPSPPPAPEVPAAPAARPVPPPATGGARVALRPLSWPRVTQADYPPLARQRGIQGTVLVRIVVGTDGAVASVQVAESSGFAVLDEDALLRARQFRFAPIDRPRAARVPIRYRLV